MRVGFNLHPAFRATGGRCCTYLRIFITSGSLPLLRRTRNIVGSMYGGSLFAVTDGAHPTMLMSALGSDHIVGTRRRPSATASRLTPPCTWISACRGNRGNPRILAREHETTRTYTVELQDKDGVVYAVVERTIYIANKKFYKQKTQGGDMHRIPGGRIAALSRSWPPPWRAPRRPTSKSAACASRTSLSEGGRALVLNGAGVRTKFVVKVYVAALYATARTSDAAALVNSAEPRRMRLHMLRDVDSKSLDGALQDGLRDNTPKQELEALKEPAQRLSALMASVGSAKEGDVIDLDFDAKGVSVSDNGKARGRIDDPAFARPCVYGWAKTRRSPP